MFFTCGIRRWLVFPQRAQCAAGRGERCASRVRSEAGPDGVVLKRVGLTARVKVRVRRRLHRRHTRIISVQIRVIHFVHVEDGWRRQVLRVRDAVGSVNSNNGASRVSCPVCVSTLRSSCIFSSLLWAGVLSARSIQCASRRWAGALLRPGGSWCVYNKVAGRETMARRWSLFAWQCASLESLLPSALSAHL